MAKQVSEILVKLGIQGLEGLDKLKSSFRELEKSIGPSDATIQRARKSILDFGDAGIRSEQIIRGQLEAFRGLKSQADINGSTFIKLSEDIKKLELELSGSTAVINKQREAILRSTAASDGNVDALRKQVDALSRLQQQTRPGSAAFIQLGKDIEKVDQKLIKVRSEAQAFALALNQIPAASVEKQVRQIETLRRTMNTLKITSDEYLNTLQRINLVSTVQATTTGRQQVRAANQMFESSLFERFVGSRAEVLPLPATTAGLQQRISEINQELANVTGYERRRALTVELIQLNRQLKNAVIEIATTEELAAMATRQRVSAAREVLSRSGFGAFSADVRARAAGGAYDPGAQKAIERARNRIVDQEAVQGIEQFYGRWEQAYSEIEGLLERHQVAKAEITAKGARTQNEILDRQHDQSLREQQRRFEEELALFDQNLRQRDQLLQRRGAIKGMLGLEGRELSPLYQGIVDIGTRRAAAEQARMGKTPQQALADIVNVFNSDLDRAGNGFLESERQLREAAIEFAGGSRKVREKFEQIALGKTPAGMFPAPGEDPAAYRQRIEAPAAGLREIIENFRKKTDRAGDGFLEAEKKLRQAAIDFAGNSEEVKRAFARVPLGKTPTSMLPGTGEVPSEYISRIRGGFEDVQLPDFASFRKGTTRELQLVRQSLQELRLDLNPLAAGFEATEKRIVRSIRNIDKELERRQIGGRRMTGMQVAQAAGAAVSGGIFGGPEGFLGGALGGVFGGVGGAFAGAAAGAQVGALRQQLGGFADYAAQIQKMEIALRNAAGSQDQFNQAMAAASAATRDLNVPQDVAIQGMTKLTAAVKGAGGQVSDAELVFKNVTAAIKATGGSAQDVDGAITAMVQVFSKGKVSAEELSGQLGERLPGAVTKFAKANDMTLPELQKALEQGQVGLNELMNFIIQLGDEYAGVAEKIAGSSQDAGARLTVAYNNMRIAVGEALQPIGAAFQEAFIPFIEGITPVLVDVLPKLGQLMLAIAKNFDTAAIAVGAFMGALAISKISLAITALGGLSSTLLILKANAVSATGALQALNATVLLNPWTALAAGVAAVAVSFYNAAKEKERFDALMRSGSAEDLKEEILRLEQQLASAEQKTASYSSELRGVGQDAGYASLEIAKTKNLLESLKSEYRVRLLFERVGVTPDSRFFGPGFAAPKAQPKPTEFPTLTADKAGKAKSAADKAAREAQRRFDQELQNLVKLEDRSLKRLLLEDQIKIERSKQEAIEAGALDSAMQMQEIASRKLDLDVKQVALSEQQAKLEELRKRGLAQGLDVTKVADKMQENILTDLELRLQREQLATQELKTQTDLRKEIQRLDRSLNQELQDRSYQLGLITEEQYNQLQIERERQRLEEQYRGLPDAQGRIDRGVDLFRREIDPTFAESLQTQIALVKRDLNELTKPINQVVGAASAIGDAFTESFTNVITGSTSARQALSDFFKNVGKYFLDMAAQIIQRMIVLAILNQIVGLLPSGGGGPSGPVGPLQSGGDFNLPGTISTGILPAANGMAFAQNGIQPFANGGIVTKPTFFKYADGGTFSNGVMGEAGPEAIMPLKRGADGKLGVKAKLDGAMTRYRRPPGTAGAVEAGGIESAAAGSETTPGGAIDVRYTVERINSVDYVTADQFRAGMQQAAQQGAAQGEQRTLRRLQQSPSTRRRIGV